MKYEQRVRAQAPHAVQRMSSAKCTGSGKKMEDRGGT